MKRMLNRILVVSLLVLSLATVKGVGAQEEVVDNETSEPVRVYVFHSKSCPHCRDLIGYLREMDKADPSLAEEFLYEVGDRNNLKLFAEVGESAGNVEGRVPFTVVGKKAVVGFQSEETTGEDLKALIESCGLVGCEDVVAGMENWENAEVTDLWLNEVGLDELAEDAESSESGLLEGLEGKTTVKVPLVGLVDLRSLSLPVLSLLIGFLDGFNPCAMWVLVFLIGLLVGMEDRKRMWLLGLAFIGASALIYLLFMTAWLQFFLFVGFVPIVRIVIGLVALGSGVIHLKNWYEHKMECQVIPAERRKKIFGRLERITKNQRLVVALVGIVLLAFSVNLVELVCSAGLPAIYTNVLSMSDLGFGAYVMNLFLYIFMFMIDDLFVFVVAMKTLQVTGISGKYTHWANLVGGVVIALLGILLIFKPAWIMFA